MDWLVYSISDAVCDFDQTLRAICWIAQRCENLPGSIPVRDSYTTSRRACWGRSPWFEFVIAPLIYQDPEPGRFLLVCHHKQCARVVMAYERDMQIVFDVVSKSAVIVFRDKLTILGPYETAKVAYAAAEQFCRDNGWLDLPSASKTDSHN